MTGIMDDQLRLSLGRLHLHGLLSSDAGCTAWCRAKHGLPANIDTLFQCSRQGHHGELTMLAAAVSQQSIDL